MQVGHKKIVGFYKLLQLGMRYAPQEVGINRQVEFTTHCRTWKHLALIARQ